MGDETTLYSYLYVCVHLMTEWTLIPLRPFETRFILPIMKLYVTRYCTFSRFFLHPLSLSLSLCFFVSLSHSLRGRREALKLFGCHWWSSKPLLRLLYFSRSLSLSLSLSLFRSVCLAYSAFSYFVDYSQLLSHFGIIGEPEFFVRKISFIF